MKIYGVDFTCAPRKAKPITVASGIFARSALHLEAIENLATFEEFEELLARPGPWLGGFDFPFSLPRELVRDLAWPAEWSGLVTHCARMSRVELRATFDAYRGTRSPGSKYVHRATDTPAGSSSPMKLVNPPVALMFHEGARRLAAADVCLPGLRPSASSRIALEAYPGLLARKQLGIRASYKSDTRSEHTPPRRQARAQIVRALKRGQPLGVVLGLAKRLETQVLEDGTGDLLDAVICAVQATWAWRKRRANYGLPADAPAGEGWILTA